MPTLPDETPTTQDICGDTNVRTGGLPDDVIAEMDNHFGYNQLPDYTPADEEAMYQAWLVTQAVEEAIDALEPLPDIQPITAKVRMPNPAAWGKAVSL